MFNEAKWRKLPAQKVLCLDVVFVKKLLDVGVLVIDLVSNLGIRNAFLIAPLLGGAF
jgi:hypothetical protein